MSKEAAEWFCDAEIEIQACTLWEGFSLAEAWAELARMVCETLVCKAGRKEPTP